MKLSVIFKAAFVLAATTSCSSLYDVWQGYDDIEPDSPEVQMSGAPRQGGGELDEVVRRAAIENSITYQQPKPPVYPELTSDQLQGIYLQAEQSNIEVSEPGTISVSAPESVKMGDDELSQLLTANELKTDETVVVSEGSKVDTVVVEEDIYTPLIVTDDYSGSVSAVAVGETVVIGGDEVEEVSIPVAEETAISEDASVSLADEGDEENGSSLSFLANQIKYNRGSDKLSTGDVKILKGVAGEYKKNRSKVHVIGYAINRKDNISVDEAMALMELANRRAEKVAATLKKQGIKDEDIVVSAEALDASSGNSVAKGDVTEIYFEY